MVKLSDKPAGWPARWLWRRISEGEMIPWWMGLAWCAWDRHGALCCLLPVNLAVRLGLAVWIWLKHPVRFFDAAWEADRLRVRLRELDRTRGDCPTCGLYALRPPRE